MVNTLQFGDIARLQELVSAAVREARAHLEERRERYDRTVDEPLNEYRQRVAVWQQDSLLDIPAQFRTRREQQVRTTASELNDMITKLHTAGEPLLRILAVLDGAR
jgi:exonuclease VII large subunit